MSLNKGKHIVKEVDEVRCTIVESKASRERVKFLTKLLKHNGYDVKIEQNTVKEEGDPITFTIGVTDVVFNHVIWVYQRKLRTLEGKKVTPDYWNQKTNKLEPNYWDKKIKH